LRGVGGEQPAGEVLMVRTFCKSGENEAIKGAVHALGAVIAATMAAYNITAWWYRRERHLGINSIVYTLAILWEIKQTTHHWERCVEATSADTEAA
jgi:hypothetical protein